MGTGTSQPRRRTRLVVLAVVVMAAIVVTWALSGSGGGEPTAAGEGDQVMTTPSTEASPPTESTETSPPADSSESPSEDSASPSADPSTEPPDATTRPSPDAGTPGTVGEGETEAVEPVSVKDPVALDAAADFGTGLTVELAAIEQVQGTARAPGEIAGPALAVTVEATNASGDAMSLDGVIVHLSYGESRTPASSFGTGNSPLPGSLAAGSSAKGSYVFAVPEDRRNDVRVEISYTGKAPTVAFAGAVN